MAWLIGVVVFLFVGLFFEIYQQVLKDDEQKKQVKEADRLRRVEFENKMKLLKEEQRLKERAEGIDVRRAIVYAIIFLAFVIPLTVYFALKS